jgi:hypothetical protein
MFFGCSRSLDKPVIAKLFDSKKVSGRGDRIPLAQHFDGALAEMLISGDQ